MSIKKTKLDAAVRRTAKIIEGHLGTLPPTEAKAVLKDLHKLAVKSSRSVVVLINPVARDIFRERRNLIGKLRSESSHARISSGVRACGALSRCAPSCCAKISWTYSSTRSPRDFARAASSSGILTVTSIKKY